MNPENKPTDKRHPQPTPLKEAIERMFAEYDIKEKADKQTVIALWPELMGNTIASRTSKLFFKGGTLYVELTSAPLKQELLMAKERILSLLNEKAGGPIVEDIVFR